MFGRRTPSPEELKEKELERARAVTPVSFFHICNSADLAQFGRETIVSQY